MSSCTRSKRRRNKQQKRSNNNQFVESELSKNKRAQPMTVATLVAVVKRVLDAPIDVNLPHFHALRFDGNNLRDHENLVDLSDLRQHGVRNLDNRGVLATLVDREVVLKVLSCLC